MENTEKLVIFTCADDLKEYIPEKGYVIRDIRLSDNQCAVWLQYQNYLN